MLSNSLNVPVLHTVHVESVDAVPAAYPKPAGHVVLVCGVHDPVPLVAENVFEKHGVQAASSAVAEPGLKPRPSGQDVIE